MQRILIPAAAALLAALLAGCTDGVAEDAAPPAPPAVPVAQPEQADVPVLLELPGHVEPIERVEIEPRVAGHVLRVAFAEGARVRRGDLLVQIDPEPYEAALAAARAKLAEAEAQARLADAEAARAKRLAGRNALSAEEGERRAAQAAVASARRAAARAEVARAALDLRHARIVAPIDGRIGRAEVTAGNLVGPGDRLAVLVADARVYVRFDVPETALGAGAPAGWRARFVLAEAPDLAFEGPLAFLDNEVGAGTGTVRARIALDAHDALLPGRYGQVRLELGRREDALLVAETAIGADQGGRYVLVVGDDDRVAYRPVVLGPRVDGRRVVEQGLAPGERVVTSGLMAVRPGMAVAALPAAPDTVAAAPAAPTED